MADTKWTNEQLQAIETRRCNLLVAAAAGSGKTAVLVERIIRIITNEENPVDIDKLLVVTFTSAAASEMRERIASAISKSLEKSPNSKNLQRQLTLLSRANITTMHSFCLDVIKNYFYTIDLDPSFRIGDETEAILMKNEIIEELFEEYYEEDNEDFKKLIEAYSSSKDDEKLKEMILSLYRFSMSGPWPQQWLKEKAEDFNISTLEEFDKSEWVKVLRDNLRVELNGFLNMYKRAIEIINDTSGLEPYLDAFYSDYNYLENAYESLNGGLNDIYIALNSISFIKLKTVKKNQVSDENAQNAVKNIRDSVKKKVKGLIESTFECTPQEALDGIIGVYPFMKTLASITLEFLRRFDEKKREKNILDFNDLEHLCLKILIDKDENNNIIPSKVAEHFREFFDEVLVDEYQDSNSVQETIIDLVSRRSLKEANVFMVGDVKQSIYRFRQAKPELFLDKYNKYSLKEGKSNRKIQLYKNFRSRQEVIEGVNYIFKMVMSQTVGELEYTNEETLNLGADFKSTNDENSILGGDIELHILDKSGIVKEENIDVSDEESEGKEEEEDIDAITLEAKIVSKRIKELFEPKDGKKFKVFDKDTNEYRDVRYKDIVILLRATKNWAEIFLDELGSEGIPVYADTGSGYFESIEIRTIMSLLKVIDNPLQDVPMIALLRSPIVGFTAEELSDLRLLHKDLYFYEIIKEVTEGIHEVSEDLKFKCVSFVAALNKWRKKSIYTPIDEFIWYLYMDTAFYGYVGAMPNGKLRQANLKILFQRAKQYESTSFKGLFNFINFINKLRKSSGDMGSAKVLGENEDVVRIMSIHKSKGLEFPVVFTSGMGKQFNLIDLSNSVLYHEKLGFGPSYVNLETRNSYSTLAKEAIKKRIRLETLSEEMRILYVALTRAKEKLIITASIKDIEQTIHKWSSNISNERRVSKYDILNGKNYMDWMMPAIIKHKDLEDIRETYNLSTSISMEDESKWSVKTWSRDDIDFEKHEKEGIREVLNTMDLSQHDTEYYEQIEKKLNFEYPYLGVVKKAASISVTEIKKRQEEYEEQEDSLGLYKHKTTLKKPKFLSESQKSEKITGARRGTIVHLIMEVLDFEKVNTESEIKAQIQDLVKRRIITEKESQVLSPRKIMRFFKSPIAKRMLSSKFVKREQKIYTQIKMNDIYLNDEIFKNNRETYENESVMLRGVIDLYFEEDDGLVILDYKTDFVDENNKKEIIHKYKKQIEIYADVLSKLTGKKVKEKYLYLFGIDEQVKVD